MSVSLFTFLTHERTFTRWFSFSIFRHSTRFSTGSLCDNHSDIGYLAINIVL